MTHQQITLVKQSWNLLREIDPELLGDVFYTRLFLKYPALRSLFKHSLVSQYKKFIAMLNLIVSRLDQPGILTEEIRQLATRHGGYGIKPEHYDEVGTALLWTLEKGLGKDWNPALYQAWAACYTRLAREMLENS
ncbi:globin domain-containing protein [Larkinella terrae]|uniref:Hemoglobin n=1 Tax=Larkinella terrae TaxID=2025311 RepID=A0A7K0EU07_9BACT|nr:globin domain-containing protein [Larkinella terrae]MRS65295.1 hemoglobin [Larkinella terrae]